MLALAIGGFGCSTQGTSNAADADAAPAEAKGEAAAPAQAPAPIVLGSNGKEGCGAAALELPAETVVARVDGKDITFADLGEDALDAERKAQSEYCSEVQRVRSAAVARAVDDALLAKAAEAAGKDKDAFVQEAMAESVKEPSDAEVEAFFSKFKSAEAPPLEQVKPQVVRAMMEERSRAAYDELIAGLKKDKQVETMLPDVRPPPVEVDVPEHAPSFGAPEAAVTVVEFSDFECPYCARAADVVGEIKEKYGDKVRFAFRHFPLSFHPNARPAAEYAQCASEQDKFWAMHDAIFANQKQLSAESLRSSAQSSGLDMTKLDECLASDRPKQAIEADMAKAKEIGVGGTPTFYINGRHYEGGISPDELGAAIEAELAQG